MYHDWSKVHDNNERLKNKRRKRVKENNYYTQDEIAAFGMKKKEISSWVGAADAVNTRGKFFYKKKRVEEIINSNNWQSWVTGRGLVYCKTKNGLDKVLIMKDPRYYLFYCHQLTSGKWIAKHIGPQGIKGLKSVETLEECLSDLRPFLVEHGYDWEPSLTE